MERHFLWVAGEYLTEYGHLLRSELTENGVARMKMDLPQAHPFIIKGLPDDLSNPGSDIHGRACLLP